MPDDRISAEINGSDGDEKSGGEMSEREEVLTDKLLRLQAEFANYRKRTRKEMAGLREKARADYIQDMFPIMFNLEKAVAEGENYYSEEYIEGLRLILEQFGELLDKYGVEEIDPEGEPFDPDRHEAIAVTPVKEDTPENTVVEVVEKGYAYRGRLIKPARVLVAGSR